MLALKVCSVVEVLMLAAGQLDRPTDLVDGEGFQLGGVD
jgi:hypothetical protein